MTILYFRFFKIVFSQALQMLDRTLKGPCVRGAEFGAAQPIDIAHCPRTVLSTRSLNTSMGLKQFKSLLSDHHTPGAAPAKAPAHEMTSGTLHGTLPQSLLTLLKRYSFAKEEAALYTEDQLAAMLWVEHLPHLVEMVYQTPSSFRLRETENDDSLKRNHCATPIDSSRFCSPLRSHTLVEWRQGQSLWSAMTTQPADLSYCISFSCGLLRHLHFLKTTKPAFSNTNLSAACESRCQAGIHNYRYHEHYHGAHSSSGVGAISQLVSLPFLAVQIFSNLVRRVLEMVDSSKGAGPSSLSNSAYNSFFRVKERRYVVAACTLLAWKLVDTNASAKVFQRCDSMLAGAAYFDRPSTQLLHRCRLVNTRLCCEDAFQEFRASKNSAYSLLKMENFVFRELSGCVGSCPLWWRVAVEVVQLYYCDDLRTGVELHRSVLSLTHLAHPTSTEAIEVHVTQHNADLNRETLETMAHRVLEQMMLNSLDILMIPFTIMQQTPPTAESSDNRARSDATSVPFQFQLKQMESAMTSHPLFGFAIVAQASERIPVSWMATLCGDVSEGGLVNAEESTVAREITRLQKLLVQLTERSSQPLQSSLFQG